MQKQTKSQWVRSLHRDLRASPILEQSVELLAKLQEPSYTIAISYLSIRNLFNVIFTYVLFLFLNPPYIHLMDEPTTTYASVPNLLLA